MSVCFINTKCIKAPLKAYHANILDDKTIHNVSEAVAILEADPVQHWNAFCSMMPLLLPVPHELLLPAPASSSTPPSPSEAAERPLRRQREEADEDDAGAQSAAVQPPRKRPRRSVIDALLNCRIQKNVTHDAWVIARNSMETTCPDEWIEVAASEPPLWIIFTFLRHSRHFTASV